MDDVVRSMVRDTEFEIMAEALGVETTDLPNAPSESFTDEEYHTGISGWSDDEPLDERELVEVNLNGHPDSGQDRPVQYQEDLDYLAQLEQANARIAELEAHSAELAQRADPELQRRLAQAHEERIVQMIANPEQAARQIYEEGLAAGRQASNINRNNAAMEAARRKYGRDFEQAFHALNSLDPNNLTAKQVVNGIMAEEDPGEAVMTWYSAIGNRGRLPPFLGGSGGPGARHMFRSLNNAPGSGVGDPFRQDYEARTDRGEEDDILGFALER